MYYVKAITKSEVRIRIAKKAAQYHPYCWFDIFHALHHFADICNAQQLEELGPLLCNCALFQHRPLDHVAFEASLRCHNRQVKL